MLLCFHWNVFKYDVFSLDRIYNRYIHMLPGYTLI